MFDKLLQFLNLNEDQKKQFEELKKSYEKEDEQINSQLMDLMKQKKETWSSKKEEFEKILTDEQKDRMKSLFNLFSPFGNMQKDFEGSC